MRLKILNRNDMVWFEDLENSVDSNEVGHDVDGTSKAVKSAFTDWRCNELIRRMDERPFMMQHRVVTRPQQKFCWRLVLTSWQEMRWVHVWSLLEIYVTFVTAVMESVHFALQIMFLGASVYYVRWWWWRRDENTIYNNQCASTGVDALLGDYYFCG